MSIVKRIKELSDNEGIKITQLEEKIGASKGVLSRSLKNNTDIQSKWVTLIVENYPQYNAEWLLTGKGLMISKKEIRIPEVKTEPECMVKSCDFMAMIDRKDKTIVEMAKEIGELQKEVSILKKQGKSTNYLSVAEP